MKRLICLLAIILPILSFASSAESSKLTLSASATIWKPADELQMKIGVVTLGSSAESALAENSEKMNQVIANLKTVGLETDDYETNHFSIHPTYTPTPKYPPEDWKPSINGYEVSNSILIHTPKLELAGKIIDEASQAGANKISDIQFGLHQSRDYWTEALTAAGHNAVNDAQALADATGVRIVRVLSINLNHAQVRPMALDAACFSKGGGCSAPPIEPGEVSLEANVTLICEIK